MKLGFRATKAATSRKGKKGSEPSVDETLDPRIASFDKNSMFGPRSGLTRLERYVYHYIFMLYFFVVKSTSTSFPPSSLSTRCDAAMTVPRASD